MDFVFEIVDKSGKSVHLSKERYKHIQRHPLMEDSQEIIKSAIENPVTIRFNESDESIKYFYKEFKERDPLERYLLVSVKYLNGNGFIITSFYTNKITGLKWKIT
jgi:hypothetical protein